MAADETLRYKNQSVFHVIGFILVIAVNILAVQLPINGQHTGEVSDKYTHLLIPVPATFGIWGIIYLALLAFTTYQVWLAFWGDHPQELVHFMHQMKHWWLISCLANASWLFAWHYEILPVSFLLMLLLLTSLIAIHHNFGIGHAAFSRREQFFLHYPFSLYLGWVSFASLANLTALMVYWGWQGQGISMITWTVLMISISAGLCVYMILQHNNIIFGLVHIWALWGVILQRRHPDQVTAHAVIHACIIAIVMIAGTILWKWYRQRTAS